MAVVDMVKWKKKREAERLERRLIRPMIMRLSAKSMAKVIKNMRRLGYFSHITYYGS
jgi:hypothetical protein